MKCGVTAITSALVRLKSEGFVPSRDLIIVFSGDEETTQQTIRDLARNHRQLIDAEFALNSDGGNGVLDEQSGRPLVYSLQTAEKVYASFELTVHSAGGHSSAPRTDNAIYDLAAVLQRLQGYHFPVMSNETTRRYFAALGKRTPGKLGAAMLDFAAHPQEGALPQSATATINCRIFPGVHLDLLAAVTRAVQRRHPGIEVVPQQASGATDGAVLGSVGIPTYGTGEEFIKDSDDFSHGLNERVPVQSFYDGLDFWHALIVDLAGSPSV